MSRSSWNVVLFETLTYTWSLCTAAGKMEWVWPHPLFILSTYVTLPEMTKKGGLS